MADYRDYYLTLQRTIKAVAFARNLTDKQFQKCKDGARFEVLEVLPVGHVLVINQMSPVDKYWVTWKMHEILWSKLFGLVESFPVMEPTLGRPEGDLREAAPKNGNASWGPDLHYRDEVSKIQVIFTDYIMLCKSRAASAAIEEYKAETEGGLAKAFSSDDNSDS